MITATNIKQQIFSLEDYMQNPPENTEWVNGQLIQKNGMTFKRCDGLNPSNERGVIENAERSGH